MEEILKPSKSKKNKLDNRGFEKPELIVIVAVLAIIIIIGIIIGSIISKPRQTNDVLVNISYNANGGTGSMKDTECKSGSNCILKTNTFVNEGYEFVGWSTSENKNSATYKTNDTYNANEDITLYAVWKIKDITITYDANGGTGEMEKTTYTYGESDILLPENTYEKKGYTFNSWHIYNPTLDKWYGCTDNVTICNDTEENNTLGWHDREEITTYYDNKVDWNTTNSEHDLIYYAQWGESTYEITYELNGGINGKDAPVSGVFESTVTISNPTRDGFAFAGWTINGTDATLNGTELTIGTSDITLTANWTAKASDYIQYLYNDTSLRKLNSLEKDDTNDNNIRYAGSNPNNYVKFNNELWRIIGVFNVSNGSTTSKRVKLIREDALLDASWDSSKSSVNNGKGINEWSQADIKNLLNGYYTGSNASCVYCNSNGQSACSNSCTSKVSKLGTTAINLIENAVWELGGIPYDDGPDDIVATVLDAYNKERGNRTGKQCSSSGTENNCTDNVNRTTEWTGKVGLIYVSDYGYASTNDNCYNNITYNKECKSNNWLSVDYSYWTITPRDSSYYANTGWYVLTSQLGDNVMSSAKGVRPSVYLKSDVTIISGDGTNSNPYVLGNNS